MRINYNVSSIIARNALNNNDRRVSASTQKLSSGYKINSASDDAAGMAIARKMNAQIKSLQRANRNSNDGLSVVNTADGAMAEMHDILQRMNELSIQAANGTNADSDREQIQKEIDQLVQELDRIANTTQFNAQSLLNGSFALKGFTNTENVTVMSYSEGVATGTYAIGQLKYSHYEDTVTKYNNEDKEILDTYGKLVDMDYSHTKGDITHKESYAADSADKVLGSLVTTTSLNQYSVINGVTAFPDGSKVVLEDENIVIRAENDFELKITLNEKEPLGNVTTTTYSTAGGPVERIVRNYDNSVTGASTRAEVTYSTVESYRNIAVEAGGKRYNIKSLNFYYETDSEGNHLNSTSPDAIYTGHEGDDGRDLRDDLAEYFKENDPDCNITIKSVTYDGTEFTVTYIPTPVSTNIDEAERTLTFKLCQDRNEEGAPMEQKELKYYMYQQTDTIKTEYTIGKGTEDDCLTFDLTGMGPMIVQVGANEGQYMEIEIPALNAVNLGVDGLDVTTEDSATAAIGTVGNAINMLSSVRAKIGAYANRLEHTITNLDTTEENMTASYARIMDVDMATEMTEYSTVQVLVQASTSMLAQANERPQQVLQLLQ